MLLDVVTMMVTISYLTTENSHSTKQYKIHININLVQNI